MSLVQIIILLLFVTGASFIQRVTGFGFGIFVMTALPHLLPSYSEATAASGIMAIVTVTISAVQTRKYLDIKKLWIIMLAFLVTSALSVFFIKHLDNGTMTRILGIFLIVAGIYFRFFSNKVSIRPTVPVQIGMGSLSGAMGGFFAMQGPPAVIYFLSCTGTKEEYMALASWYFLIGNSAMTIFRAGNGFVTAPALTAVAIGLPAVIAGQWIGTAVYRKISISGLRKAVNAYLIVAGILTLLK